MFLRWVYVSAITLCSCLACGCCCLSLKFFLVVVFGLHHVLGWIFLWFLILTKLVLMVCFKIFLLWMCSLLCWVCMLYCVNPLGASVKFYYVVYESCYFSFHCMSHWHIFVFRMFSIFDDLILPVVLVFPLLGLFIHVVILSSIMLKCSSLSVWLQFLC